MVDQLAGLIEINNQYYSSVPLRISLGLATAEPNERLEATIRIADERMYEAKRLHYAAAVSETVGS
jgi:PleD family two-component response regulator